MTISPDDFEKLLVAHVDSRQRFQRARNKNRFMTTWPVIRAMLNKGWTLTAICEVLKENHLLELNYEALRRYVREQRNIEAGASPAMTPKKGEATRRTVMTKKSDIESKGVKKSEDTDTPSYSVPPKFGRRTDDLDDVAFMLGKVEK